MLFENILRILISAANTRYNDCVAAGQGVNATRWVTIRDQLETIAGQVRTLDANVDRTNATIGTGN